MAKPRLMMGRVLEALRKASPAFKTEKQAINCHHKIMRPGRSFRRAGGGSPQGGGERREGELGIQPGLDGTGSFIVEGSASGELPQLLARRRPGAVARPGQEA